MPDVCPVPRIVIVDPADSLGPDLVQAARGLAPDVAVVEESSPRAARRALAVPGTAVLLLGLSGQDDAGLLDLARHARTALRDRTLRIVTCATPAVAVGARLLVERHGVDLHRPLATLDAEAFAALLLAEVRTWRQLHAAGARREAELALVTALARFSRAELALEDYFAELHRTIAAASGAQLTLLLQPDAAGALVPAPVVHVAAGAAPPAAADLAGAPALAATALAATAAADGKTRVCLDRDDAGLRAAAGLAGVALAGSVAFPLRCYDRTLAVVQCFLAADQLDGLTVSLMSLIEKSAGQLAVLLERREAEARLEEQYRRLRATLSELTDTRNQLYHAEKMASLGQLAAGIAHEINNPLSFVMSNFTPMDQYVRSMTDLLGLHTRFLETLDAGESARAHELRGSIASLSAEVDVNFVVDDVRALVQESRDGLVRVKEIIAGLRAFARAEQGAPEPADLHAGLDATLRMLRHRLEGRIEVVRRYGDLPAVTGHIGLLNQVFMNLLSNAAQAIDGPGRIEIETRREGGDAIVAIRDSGAGIDPQDLPHLFNPFFTTKPVGEGTGLGLSIAWSIVGRHGGTIEVDSRPGAGSEFRVRLPIEGAQPAAA